MLVTKAFEDRLDGLNPWSGVGTREEAHASLQPAGGGARQVVINDAAKLEAMADAYVTGAYRQHLARILTY